MSSTAFDAFAHAIAHSHDRRLRWVGSSPSGRRNIYALSRIPTYLVQVGRRYFYTSSLAIAVEYAGAYPPPQVRQPDGQLAINFAT